MRRLALLFSCLLLLAAPAGARQLVIESFTVEVHVNADGVIDVTETIRPRFTGQWNGIYRSIPVEYRTPQGFNYSLLLEPLGVAGGGGGPPPAPPASGTASPAPSPSSPAPRRASTTRCCSSRWGWRAKAAPSATRPAARATTPRS